MVERNELTNARQSNQADTPVGTPSPSLDARVRVAVSQEPVTPEQWVTEAVPSAHCISILEAARVAQLYWMPSSSKRNCNYRLVFASPGRAAQWALPSMENVTFHLNSGGA